MPTPLWQEPDERSEEGAIGWPERRTIRLPSEHCELVAQDEQLDVFGELAPPSSNNDALIAPPPTACTVEPGF